jgi:hypothetical protein
VKLAPTADAYVNQKAATTNFGTSRSLASRGTAGYRSYLRFAIPTPPPGKRLLSAVLTVHTSKVRTAGSSADHAVKLAGNTWNERTLTWNRRPRITTTTLGTFRGATGRNAAHSAPLAVAKVAKLAGRRATFAVTSRGSDNLWIWSGEAAGKSLRPVLVLTYG